MSTILYDKPVKDLIAQLDATGHVTHRQFQKKSVTLHHNGGRLSHEGVLQVWRTRPASAHFDVDRVGAVAQYVRVNEYAWAVGNTRGNEETISIEMANLNLAPGWEVAEVTWRSAARLAGWLFAKVIGQRPSSSNFFVHSHWSSTACAGPYISKVWAAIMLEAQEAYDYFKGAKVPTPPPAKKPVPPAPKPVPSTTVLRVGSQGPSVVRLQEFLRGNFPAYKDSVNVRHGQLIGVDGSFGAQTEAWVQEFQKRTGLVPDGVVGPRTFARMRSLGYRY